MKNYYYFLKNLLFVLFIIYAYSLVEAQGTVKIDGAISYTEISDTTKFKKLFSDEFTIIKESRGSYYIAIRTNSFTIGNVLIYDGKETVKVMHASFSLGDVDYKKDGDKWQPAEKKFTWDYVDPMIRSTFADIDPQIELAAFYKKHKWVANTAPQGSYREMEFLISKKLLNADSKLIVAFTSTKDDKRQASYWPSELKQFTQDTKLDARLLGGYLPRDIVFELDGFGSLKE